MLGVNLGRNSFTGRKFNDGRCILMAQTAGKIRPGRIIHLLCGNLADSYHWG